MNDNSFLRELFQAEYLNLYRYAFRLVREEELAKDIVQETFLTALLRQNQLLGHAAPAHWLKTVALNLIRNERRKAANRRTVWMEDLPEALFAWEDAKSLNEALPAALSAEERQLLIWRFEDRLDDQLIANRLGVTRDAVKMRVSRALRRCRQELENSGEP